MPLAQIGEAVQAANKVLDQSAQYGFLGYALAVVYLTMIGGLGLHFWKVVLPERDARIKSTQSMNECLATLSQQSIRTTAVLESQEALLQKLDNRLSTIENAVEQHRCEWREANLPRRASSAHA
jgi:hypothetical protein